MSIFIIILVFLGLAAGLAWYLIGHDKGEREPIGALWVAFGLGVLGGIAAGIIETVLLSTKDLTPGAPTGTLLLTTIAVGIIEESCKFVPLSLFIFNRRYFNEHTDGVIYFALAGLGFGLPENILYTLSYGAKAGVARIFLTPVFHAATTAIVGYFLIKGKLAHKSRTLSWLVLGLMMLLHGLYDFGLSTGLPGLALMSIMITAVVSTGLFVVYSKATALDQKFGLSVVGNNSFCRACGFANPKHGLYCTRCGKYA